LFLHDDGRTLLPTARSIWDVLLEDRPGAEVVGTIADTEAVFGKLRAEAERHGQAGFEELHAKHRERLRREHQKGQSAYQVRREALNRIGLPEVRQHRLRRLDEEERAWETELRQR